MYFSEEYKIKYSCHSGSLAITEEGHEIEMEDKIFPIDEIPVFCPLCNKGHIVSIE